MSRRERKAKAKRSLLTGGLAAGALLAAPGSAQADNFLVNSTDDHNDNFCNAAPDCTLREAIGSANANSNAPTVDTITFAGTVTGTISLDVGFLTAIAEPLTISGPGADELTLDATTDNRIFYISTDPGDDVTISGLTVTGGNVTTTTAGGGILNLNSDLTVSEAAIIGNTARSGGGISTFGGTLTVESSEVTGNIALRSDTANAEGGGILALTEGAVTIRNSTIAGNSATTTDPLRSAFGGGIRTRGFPGPLTTIESSTVVENSVSGEDAHGGGIGNQTQDTVTPLLRNSIVSGNTATGTTISGHDLYSNYLVFDGEFSLVQDASDVTLNDPIAGSNITGVDPQLGLFTYNGGPTRTMAPAPGSPAIDKGRSFCLETDQRGSARPSDLATANSAATGADGSDIGAFETQGGSIETPALCLPPEPPPDDPARCQGKEATIEATGRVVDGTAKRDVIVGTSAANLIKARGGNDLVCALGGKDQVLGGGGNDTLLGQGGRDTLKGQGGKDKLIGGPGRDILVGGPGRDLQRQ